VEGENIARIFRNLNMIIIIQFYSCLSSDTGTFTVLSLCKHQHQNSDT